MRYEILGANFEEFVLKEEAICLRYEVEVYKDKENGPTQVSLSHPDRKLESVSP